jgi:hypothetical protein
MQCVPNIYDEAFRTDHYQTGLIERLDAHQAPSDAALLGQRLAYCVVENGHLGSCHLEYNHMLDVA